MCDKNKNGVNEENQHMHNSKVSLGQRNLYLQIQFKMLNKQLINTVGHQKQFY